MSTMTVKRSKALPTDGPTARFLYEIIKQLDLKSIDWNLVASQLEISNGHAARMRYSRFKQQMDGTASTPRPAKLRVAPNRVEKKSTKGENLFSKRPISPPPVRVKQETGSTSARFFPYNANINPYLKHDAFMEQFPSLAQIPQSSPRRESMQIQMQMQMPIPSIEPMTVPYPNPMAMSSDFSMQSHLAMFPPRLEFMPHLHQQPLPPAVQQKQQQQKQQQQQQQQQHQSQSQIETNHVWVPVKSEPADDDDCPCDVLIKLEEDEDQQPLIEVVREQTAKESDSSKD